MEHLSAYTVVRAVHRAKLPIHLTVPPVTTIPTSQQVRALPHVLINFTLIQLLDYVWHVSLHVKTVIQLLSAPPAETPRFSWSTRPV